jgi:NAD(P)-dependent dehydrogenase (short-subunit alcohol dehydrogenase family)
MTARGAFVTGGASGIGLAAARRLLTEGWRVAIADHDAAALDRAAAELADAGDRLVRLALDVTDEAAVEAAVAEAAARIGPLKGVVNSAGIAQDKPFGETSAAEFRRILDVNVVGSFLVGRAAVKTMAAAGGAIVNLASISGLRGNLGRTAYGASKGGVITMTQVMAVELARDGIRVNAVAPGPVDTAMVRALHGPARRAAFERRVPLRRYAEPEEIATVIAFLLDEARSSYVTGQIIGVDGGFLSAGIMRE